MSIFESIMSKIFQAGTTAVEEGISSVIPGAKAAAPAQPASPAAPAATPAPASPAAPPAVQSAASAPVAPAQPVDVEAVLTSMAAQKGGGNWQTSIVDLLKLLDLDSSLQSRTQLAQELDVHAGANGSAEENAALHKAVMQKLADNGGKVPASLMG